MPRLESCLQILRDCKNGGNIGRGKIFRNNQVGAEMTVSVGWKRHEKKQFEGVLDAAAGHFENGRRQFVAALVHFGCRNRHRR